MKKIVFATNNNNKIKEVTALLGNKYHFLSLNDINCLEELEETSPTIEGNALQKARYVFNEYNEDCFSEDTGLEIKALNGAPGVITARYAGPERDNDANMAKVMAELSDKTDRSARFKTVIALILDGKEYLFEGIINGKIATEKSGEKGFGYDPIFIPEDHSISFAEMNATAKNKISHRGRAVQKLMSFLESK